MGETESGGIGPAEMLKLKRWNSPTIYNGWEAIARRDRLQGCYNREETRDFMPSLGTMVGRAVTILIDSANSSHPRERPEAWEEWYGHLASLPGPKIVVMRDLSAERNPGSFWGEVSANTHRSLGCVGAIVDGTIRDVDEMTNAGFKALARRLCVGHLYSWPVEWGKGVEVFGTRIEEGMLVHADKHGFIGIPPEDEPALLGAVRAMDDAECETVIPAVRFSWGSDAKSILGARSEAAARFKEIAARAALKGGEW